MIVTKTVIKFKDKEPIISNDPVEVKSINKYKSELRSQFTEEVSILFDYTDEPIESKI